MDCKTVFNFKVLLVSVLFFVAVTSPHPIASEDPDDSILNNPCTYDNSGNENEKGRRPGKRAAKDHIKVHLNMVKIQVNKSLRHFEKNYQESKLIDSDHFNLKAGRACSMLMAYRNLQVYVRALDWMRSQNFSASDIWNKEDRESNITAVLNKSTTLLCEFYDDLHKHSLANQTKVSKNKKLIDARKKIPMTIDRTRLSTQDRVVFKQFQKFLKNLEVFLESDRTKCKNIRKSKSEKKGDITKKKTKNKKQEKLPKNRAGRRRGSS